MWDLFEIYQIINRWTNRLNLHTRRMCDQRDSMKNDTLAKYVYTHFTKHTFDTHSGSLRRQCVSDNSHVSADFLLVWRVLRNSEIAELKHFSLYFDRDHFNRNRWNYQSQLYITKKSQKWFSRTSNRLIILTNKVNVRCFLFCVIGTFFMKSFFIVIFETISLLMLWFNSMAPCSIL